jgi:hypothetical protein
MRTIEKEKDGERQLCTAVKAAFVGAKIVSPAVVVTAVAKPAFANRHRCSGSW